MDTNPELTIDLLSQYALDLMEKTYDSMFLTGKAGTGKTTLLKEFIQKTEKKVVVLASTGIAAIHIGGQTIHSFFRLSNHLDPDDVDELTGRNAKVLYEADTVIIDEVSMVRADVMECVDRIMRWSLDIDVPFGGKQMIFVGDLYQLPPVVSQFEQEMFTSKYSSAYFFASPAYQELCPHVVSLQTVYRQHEKEFAHILNKIRIGLQRTEDLARLDQNVRTDYPQGAIYLTTTNKQADELNDRKLQSLEGESHAMAATINGKISQSMYPNQVELEFKVGAQVMMIKNGKGYSNGSLGIITAYDPSTQQATVVIEDTEILIEPHTRQVLKPVYDKELEKIIPEPVGSFQQLPFRLAWAITIHKAQGLTFDNVVVDFSQGVFAQGQSYVALSRARSLQGLYLTQSIKNADISINPEVKAYMHQALREQTHYLVHSAIENSSTVRFLYDHPSLGPQFLEVQPTAVGDLEYEGYNFQGIKGIVKGESTEKAFSYGRIHDVEII